MKPQDFDQLSAYLDNQLPPVERAALEARLAAEPELRTTLAELRLTVQALRGLPSLRPPRSFALTPAQAGITARRPALPMFGALRLAAALSALVLVVTVAGDFAGTRLAPASTSTNMAAAPAEATAVAQAEAPAAAITEETKRASDAGDSGAAGGAAAGAAEAEAATPLPPMATAAPAGTVMPAMAPQPTATPEMAALGAPAPTETMEAPGARAMDATPEPSPKEAGTPASTEDVLLGAPSGGGPEGEADAAYATGVANDAYAAPGLPPIRVLELALAGLTVLLGLGAWLTRRPR